MHALVLLWINQHTKFQTVPSFTDSTYITGTRFFKRFTWSWPRPLKVCLSSQG